MRLVVAHSVQSCMPHCHYCSLTAISRRLATPRWTQRRVEKGEEAKEQTEAALSVPYSLSTLVKTEPAVRSGHCLALLGNRIGRGRLKKWNSGLAGCDNWLADEGAEAAEGDPSRKKQRRSPFCPFFSLAFSLLLLVLSSFLRFCWS